MKIGLRGGHSPNCKGVFGYLDEQAEVRKIYRELVPMLIAKGHTVVNCNSDAYTEEQELYEGTSKANSNGCDIFVSIHMNGFNNAANGTECWLYDQSNGSMNQIAEQICKNFKSKGFYNRGTKYSTGYYDLSETNMPAMIIETLFCDNKHDVDIYNSLGAKGIARLIADGINKQVSSGAVDVSKPVPPVSANGLKELGKVNIWARGYTDRWWDEVLNATDWVGARDGEPLRYLAFRVSVGQLKARVHTQANGWLEYIVFGQSYNINDLVNGVVGDGSPIDALEVEYLTPEGYKYKYAKYCLSDINNESYYPYQVDNQVGGGQDGYAGVIGIAADKLIIDIV